MTALRRSVMTLYSGPMDIYSHQVRIVLAEKGVTVDILAVDLDNPPQGLSDVNPYNSLPTLIDRDLVLYHAPVILEYLDERFPHPPLLPVYPVARAKSRTMMKRIEQDWYSLYRDILSGDTKRAEEARKALRDSLVSLTPVFADMSYFLSEEYTLVDACIGPLLWRLPLLEIELPKSAKAVEQYGQRLFERDAFQVSLSEEEREMREVHEL